MNLAHRALPRAVATLSAAGLLTALLVSPAIVSAKDSLVKQAADGKIKPLVIGAGGVTRQVRGLSGGVLDSAKGAPAAQREVGAAAPVAPAPSTAPQQLGVAADALGCGRRDSDGNVRVNQDCTFRRQAEEIIKINPTNARNIIAGQNDFRVGFNHCGFDFSFDGGQHWGDGTPPFWGRFNLPEVDGPNAFNPNTNTIAGAPGTAHTYDFATDPIETFDSAGRAFFGCLVLDVNSNASGLFVTQSPLGAGGAFYDEVPDGTVDPAVGPTDATKRFVVVEDNGTLAGFPIVHDKPFLAADAFPGSPTRDNVYVTWTVFIFQGRCVSPANPVGFCSAPIFGSMSTDHAVTWSTPEEISGASPLCFQGNFFDPTRPPNSCDVSSGSDPQPMPDGSLVVPFFNQNTPIGNPNNQQLAVVCKPSGSSTSGSAHLNCGAPAKVGDDVVTGEPLCNFGRGPEECVPGPFIRTDDFPRVGLDKDNASVFVVWHDYRNGEYDIQLSRSSDGGHTWTDAGTVNAARGADFYQPAIDVGSDHKVAVSFYRSDRVPNENTLPVHNDLSCGLAPPALCFAPSDPGVQQKMSSYWLSGRKQPDRETKAPFSAVRLSPLFPPPDGSQTGFNGDYSGLAVHDSTAHAIWSDTRNVAAVTSPTQGVVHDEDIFTQARSIPTAPGDED